MAFVSVVYLAWQTILIYQGDYRSCLLNDLRVGITPTTSFRNSSPFGVRYCKRAWIMTVFGLLSSVSHVVTLWCQKSCRLGLDRISEKLFHLLVMSSYWIEKYYSHFCQYIAGWKILSAKNRNWWWKNIHVGFSVCF